MEKVEEFATPVYCAPTRHRAFVIASTVFRECDFYQRIDTVRAPGKHIAADKPPETWINVICDDHGVSARERTVLELLEKGMTYSEMSEALFISPGTIRVHVSNLYRKFGVHSREDLFAQLKEARAANDQATTISTNE